MTDGKTPHYLVDLDFCLVADLSISHEDYKSFYSGNSIAFACNVLDFNIILISNHYWSSWIGSA